MLSIDDIRPLVRAEPFVPFSVLTRDGRRFFIADITRIAIGLPDEITVVDDRSGEFEELLYSDIAEFEIHNHPRRETG